MKISIVTANYNQGRWLPNCIESIHSQRYPALEHIVIDGGSTDGSVDIIRGYSAKLAYWCSEKDKGQYDAINKGFERSTGEIMAFLNADDLYLPWTLQTVASIFEALPEVEWLVSTRVGQVNETGAAFASGVVLPPSRNVFLDGFCIPGEEMAIGCIVQEGVFWRRSLWERAKARLNLEHGLGADFDLWCQFFRHAEPYASDVPLAAMTRHPTQRSNDSVRYQKECRLSLETLRKDLGYKPRFLGIKNRMLKLSMGRPSLWRFAKYACDYHVKSVSPKYDASGYQQEWSAGSYRLIL